MLVEYQVSAPEKKSSDLIDSNCPATDHLKTLPGIGDAYAEMIIKGRPYKMKTQLKSKKIIPGAMCDKIAGMIIAMQK